MPRHLPKEEEVEEKFKRPDLQMRREVLRDTVAQFSDSERRRFFQESARENHQRWKTSPSSTFTGKVRVIEGDWGEVTQTLSKEAGAIYAVLNMANAKKPGGGYHHGQAAQEENMFRRTDCHFSIPDEVLDDTKTLYVPAMGNLINAVEGRVYFDMNPRVCIKGKEDPNPENASYAQLPPSEYFLFYELRSAADDLDVKGGPSKPFDESSMRRKIAAQLDTCIEKGVRHIVLSAFGCGAFRNPPDKVAQIYKEELLKRPGSFDDVAFAIFYAGYGPRDNIVPFQEILHDLSLAPVNPTDQYRQAMSQRSERDEPDNSAKPSM